MSPLDLPENATPPNPEHPTGFVHEVMSRLLCFIGCSNIFPYDSSWSSPPSNNCLMIFADFFNKAGKMGLPHYNPVTPPPPLPAPLSLCFPRTHNDFSIIFGFSPFPLPSHHSPLAPSLLFWTWQRIAEIPIDPTCCFAPRGMFRKEQRRREGEEEGETRPRLCAAG